MQKILLECINKTFMFKHIIDLLSRVSSTVWGWLLAILTFLTNLIAPEWYSFTVVLIAICLDALFGIIVSVKNKKFTLSKLMRVTSFKIASYGAGLLIFLLIEKLAHDTGFIGVKVAAAWAAACEFWSMSASILIIWPDAYFFRILRKQLKGEIENKLGRSLGDTLPDED